MKTLGQGKALISACMQEMARSDSIIHGYFERCLQNLLPMSKACLKVSAKLLVTIAATSGQKIAKIQETDVQGRTGGPKISLGRAALAYNGVTSGKLA